jgi:hypothetical protein
LPLGAAASLRAARPLRHDRLPAAVVGQRNLSVFFKGLDAYEEYLWTDKQNKAVSVANTMYRLETFFSDKDTMLGDLTPRACESYYEELRKRSTRNKKVFSVDSHRTILAAAKTFPAVVYGEAEEVDLAKSGGGGAGCREEEARKASAPNR